MKNNPQNTTLPLFFSEKNNSHFNHTTTSNIIKDALTGMDDGELFLEYHHSEQLSYDDGRLCMGGAKIRQGFGLRGIKGAAVGFAHASELSHDALKDGLGMLRTVRDQATSQASGNYKRSSAAPTPLYIADNPIHTIEFKQKVEALSAIDHYIRRKDNRVRQVSASISNEWQAIHIIKPDREDMADIRPLVRLNISVTVEQDGRMEQGSSGAGGRTLLTQYIDPTHWQAQADEALRQALVNLEAIAAPAGEFPVILGNGWTGVLLHEAVGHGLEGDFNRKGTSAFSGLMGKQVASKGVTIVDDGTIPDRRGSLTIDDEGTPTQNTTLIEDGMLVGYMQDHQNAALMGVAPTGNGRRESYAALPMPRMTNTYMLAGNDSQADMIADVKRGIFAKHFGGGQVDITSGQFVFSATEAYMIENGKITSPIKGATLIGNGPDSMQKIIGIGNDLALDDGIGTCGKDGQSVPVGVGQPSLAISAMTVGGTNTA